MNSLEWLRREGVNVAAAVSLDSDADLIFDPGEADWENFKLDWRPDKVSAKATRFANTRPNAQEKREFLKKLDGYNITWFRAPSQIAPVSFDEWKLREVQYIDLLFSGWQNLRFKEQVLPLVDGWGSRVSHITKDAAIGGLSGRLALRVWDPVEEVFAALEKKVIRWEGNQELEIAGQWVQVTVTENLPPPAEGGGEFVLRGLVNPSIAEVQMIVERLLGQNCRDSVEVFGAARAQLPRPNKVELAVELHSGGWPSFLVKTRRGYESICTRLAVMETAGGLECEAHGFPVSPASRMRHSREVNEASDTLPDNLEHRRRVIVNGIASLEALVEGLRGKGIRLLSIDPCLAAPRQDRGEKLSRVVHGKFFVACRVPIGPRQILAAIHSKRVGVVYASPNRVRRGERKREWSEPWWTRIPTEEELQERQLGLCGTQDFASQVRTWGSAARSRGGGGGRRNARSGQSVGCASGGGEDDGRAAGRVATTESALALAAPTPSLDPSGWEAKIKASQEEMGLALTKVASSQGACDNRLAALEGGNHAILETLAELQSQMGGVAAMFKTMVKLEQAKQDTAKATAAGVASCLMTGEAIMETIAGVMTDTGKLVEDSYNVGDKRKTEEEHRTTRAKALKGAARTSASFAERGKSISDLMFQGTSEALWEARDAGDFLSKLTVTGEAGDDSEEQEEEEAEDSARSDSSESDDVENGRQTEVSVGGTSTAASATDEPEGHGGGNSGAARRGGSRLRAGNGGGSRGGRGRGRGRETGGTKSSTVRAHSLVQSKIHQRGSWGTRPAQRPAVGGSSDGEAESKGSTNLEEGEKGYGSHVGCVATSLGACRSRQSRRVIPSGCCRCGGTVHAGCLIRGVEGANQLLACPPCATQLTEGEGWAAWDGKLAPEKERCGAGSWCMKGGLLSSDSTECDKCGHMVHSACWSIGHGCNRCRLESVEGGKEDHARLVERGVASYAPSQQNTETRK